MKTNNKAEYGDFQTPDSLATSATERLVSLGIRARTIIEPTCGRGSFLFAAAKLYPNADNLIGLDINEAHLDVCRERLSGTPDARISLRQADFFTMDWEGPLNSYPRPWLVLGNPPWVTSAAVSALEGTNVPEKSNFHQRRGIDAITGKSNFDISEWMLLSHLDWFDHRSGTIAMLCKVAVARKILSTAWKRRIPIRSAHIFGIDAAKHFEAAVDAGFFVLELGADGRATTCDVYGDIGEKEPTSVIGYFDGLLVSDASKFRGRQNLLGADKNYTWRSGIKHDCSKVMELSPSKDGYRNGLGEMVKIEPDYLFPMMKSSDLGNDRNRHRVMLVTQQSVGNDTSQIEEVAPKTWQYLQDHRGLLDGRGSKIYKNKPSFSIFGVGPYSFTPWKVAISGFYKNLRFSCIGPADGKPIVFDDTIYFLPCASEAEARLLERILNSDAAQEFYMSMIFWSEKRPITVELLKRLDLYELAAKSGLERAYTSFTGSNAFQPTLLPVEKDRLRRASFAGFPVRPTPGRAT